MMDRYFIANITLLDVSLQHLASACGGWDNYKGEIKIWQMKSCRCRKTLLFHASQITCLSYSRDDRFIISLGELLMDRPT